jgi:4-alpha-glucanotransferase
LSPGRGGSPKENSSVTHHHGAEPLDRLASLAGIEPMYYDIWGNKHHTSHDAKRAILSSMGIEVIEAELHRRLNAKWLRLMEPTLVVPVSKQPPTIRIHLPLEEGCEKDVRVSLSVEDEDGRKDIHEIEGIKASATREIDGMRYVRAELLNRTDRDLGYYGVRVLCVTPSGEHSARMRLIVTPEACYEPQGRRWGIYANLYALRSARNWGVGDLTDLRDVLRWAGSDLGADFVGINPLHAINNRMPYGISPYSSTSRLYANFIYLDLEKISAGAEFRKLIASPEFKAEIEALRRSDLIDYEGVAALKMRALEAAFKDFLKRHLRTGTSLAEAFRGYVASEGKPLEDFATFSALEEHLRAKDPGLYTWQDWPEECRSAESPAVGEFKREHGDQVLFHQYVQWLMDRQLREASDEAKSIGMGVGIYADLAVGSSGSGSDAWSFPEVFGFGMEAGAPPDNFSLNGQSWGFPPLIPERLRETGYELFVQTIRKNLKYSGALRIDHALGLFRLFWVPRGMSPKEGTYVRYPHEDLLRIIALESVRNKAVIIAEDLGTVSDEIREALLDFGMLSYRLFYFERDWKRNVFRRPEEYPERALTAVTTHDLPTLRGYWEGHDMEVKKALGLYPDEEAYRNDVAGRKRDRERIIEALGHCLPEGYEPPEKMTPELSLCVHRHIGRSPAKLAVAALDDILGVLDQQNMPGTIDAHPNWRQKYPEPVEEVFKNRHARDLARMFREEGRAR